MFKEVKFDNLSFENKEEEMAKTKNEDPNEIVNAIITLLNAKGNKLTSSKVTTSRAKLEAKGESMTKSNLKAESYEITVL